MRWIIRLSILGAIVAAEQLIINAWVARAVTRYQHTFWGQRRG